jgi:tRNA dimethylallyltransferase
MPIAASKPPLALIAGPTASGKSALALALAEQEDGVIVNADSAQIYRDLPILSAAPSSSEAARAEHRLYGIQDGALPCSAAQWAGLAKREIGDIHARGRLPILVGGTGLYLRTLIEGIAPVPPIDPAERERIRARGVDDNRAELERRDPVAAARLAARDSARIARALEVVVSTGKALSEWQLQRAGGIGGEVALRPIVVLPPRDWLYARCDERFSGMFDGGALGEVEQLLARSLNRNLPVMRAIGVREIAQYLSGESTREQAIAAGQQATRRYAKRQFTWFAHQPPTDWPRATEPLDATGIAAALAVLGAKP